MGMGETSRRKIADSRPYSEVNRPIAGQSFLGGQQVNIQQVSWSIGLMIQRVCLVSVKNAVQVIAFMLEDNGRVP